MSRLANLDFSTIDTTALRKLPVLSDTMHRQHTLQTDCGNGCAGDPPGYPTYFTRDVYTSLGKSSRFGPVITFEGKHYDLAYENDWETGKTRLLKLWKPLPLDHPRTQAWILSTFKHHHSCYQVPQLRAEGRNWSDAMLIWPGGCLGKTPFGHLRRLDFEVEQARKNRCFDKWTPEHQDNFVKEIEAENARITEYCKAVAIPENHDATILVRHHYPEFEPTNELIAAQFDSPGNWWETLAECPTPETCPGQYSMKHPTGGSWCQMCGWHESEQETEKEEGKS